MQLKLSEKIRPITKYVSSKEILSNTLTNILRKRRSKRHISKKNPKASLKDIVKHCKSLIGTSNESVHALNIVAYATFFGCHLTKDINFAIQI